MKATCFICGVDSHLFEKKPGVNAPLQSFLNIFNTHPRCALFQGFERHVRHEHNQWAYVFFFMHLDRTRSNDLSALELYVESMVRSHQR